MQSYYSKHCIWKQGFAICWMMKVFIVNFGAFSRIPRWRPTECVHLSLCLFAERFLLRREKAIVSASNENCNLNVIVYVGCWILNSCFWRPCSSVTFFFLGEAIRSSNLEYQLGARDCCGTNSTSDPSLALWPQAISLTSVTHSSCF